MSASPTCPEHPAEPFVGACARCGDFVCRLCLPTPEPLCPRCATAPDLLDVSWPTLGEIFHAPFVSANPLPKHALAGACVLLSPLLVPHVFLLGYCVRFARGARVGRRDLPEWRAPGRLFVDGAGMFFAWLVGVSASAMPGAMAMTALAAVLGPGTAPPGNPPIAVILAAEGALFLCAAVMLPAIKVVYVRTGSWLAPFLLPSLARVMFARPSAYAKLALTCFLVSFLGKVVPYAFCYLPLGLFGPWGYLAEAYAIGRFAGWLEGQESAAKAVFGQRIS